MELKGPDSGAHRQHIPGHIHGDDRSCAAHARQIEGANALLELEVVDHFG